MEMFLADEDGILYFQWPPNRIIDKIRAIKVLPIRVEYRELSRGHSLPLMVASTKVSQHSLPFKPFAFQTTSTGPFLPSIQKLADVPPVKRPHCCLSVKDSYLLRLHTHHFLSMISVDP